MPVKVLVSYNAEQAVLDQIRAVSDALLVEKSTSKEEAIRLAAEAEVIFAGHFWEELWKAAPRLRWVQSWGAGIERFLTPEFIASPIILTNAQGCYALPIADHVMGFVLHFSRGLNLAARSQIGHRWGVDREPDELGGRTMGIIGLGGIGSEVARRAKAFGMRVIAVRRRPERSSQFADEVRGPDGLDWLLGESDYVALCAALTPETQHLIGEEQLRKMKPTAHLINIGRGGLVDEAALTAALQEGRIAGAGLDVFETEPLPSDSPLWDMPNVLITPHDAGSSPKSHDRLMALFCENLRRYLAGEELLNVVDKGQGY